MVVLVLLKASSPPIQLASASCTGSCRCHQSRSLSSESQNTCQVLWTGAGSLLACFERTCTLRLCSGNKTSWGFRGFSFWIRFRVEESCYSRGQGITWVAHSPFYSGITELGRRLNPLASPQSAKNSH